MKILKKYLITCFLSIPIILNASTTKSNIKTLNVIPYGSTIKSNFNTNENTEYSFKLKDYPTNSPYKDNSKYLNGTPGNASIINNNKNYFAKIQKTFNNTEKVNTLFGKSSNPTESMKKISSSTAVKAYVRKSSNNGGSLILSKYEYIYLKPKKSEPNNYQ